jgi:hypothetical protein
MTIRITTPTTDPYTLTAGDLNGRDYDTAQASADWIDGDIAALVTDLDDPGGATWPGQVSGSYDFDFLFDQNKPSAGQNLLLYVYSATNPDSIPASDHLNMPAGSPARKVAAKRSAKRKKATQESQADGKTCRIGYAIEPIQINYALAQKSGADREDVFLRITKSVGFPAAVFLIRAEHRGDPTAPLPRVQFQLVDPEVDTQILTFVNDQKAASKYLVAVAVLHDDGPEQQRPHHGKPVVRLP